jgi:deoxyribonuclease-4
MKIGFHISIKGGVDKTVDRAIELRCNTFQMFTRSPRMWKARELDDHEISKFKDKLSSSEINPVFSHMPYLSNIASPDKTIYEKSCDAFRVEIERCITLGIPFIVTHLGSHMGSGKKKGVEQITSALKTMLSEYESSPIILLENTSGKTNDMGSTFEELEEIIEIVGSNKIGLCLDTCHAFVRGYDVRSFEKVEKMIREIDQVIGLKNLYLLHLNDSKGDLGSRLDRHEHIGLGTIGENGFRYILSSRLTEKPMVMETPIDEKRNDKENMSKVIELSRLGMSK